MSDFLTFTILGVVTGSIYAVAASGLVVTYTTSGIFNFAHGAVGMVAAFTYWELRINRGWPAPVALVVCILVLAPLLGAVIERVLMRGLSNVSQATSLVVTIGLMLGLIGLANTIWEARDRQLPEFFGENNRAFELFDVVIDWHQVITVVVAVLVAVFLRLLLFRTRIGVAMRAQVDDRNLASLNGGRPGRISMLSWALGSSLAAVAGILLAPILQLNVLTLTLLVINAYAAAMVGRLKSLPLTFLGALLLGLAESYAVRYLPDSGIFQNLKPAIPTLFLFGVLLLLPEMRLRGGSLVASAGTRNPSLRASLLGGVAIVAGAWFASGLFPSTELPRLGEAIALGLVMLSLVPLTGYAGQVSLCSMTFAGLGCYVMVKLGTGGLPILALVAAAGLAAVVGAVIALPALRLQGLYLALATLAFAVFMDNVFFSDSRVFGSFGTADVPRVDIPGFDLGDERTYIMFLAVVFALVSVAVLALRRGKLGRRLAAMRDSPAACATLGLNLTTLKLVVFVFSAAIAGLGGALFGGLRGSAGGTDFLMVQSLPILLLAVIGGISTVSGALMGGLFLTVLFPTISDTFPSLTEFVFLATGLAGVSLGRQPHGIAVQAARRLAPLSDQWRRNLRPQADEAPLPPEELALEADGSEVEDLDLDLETMSSTDRDEVPVGAP
ncbi:MAG: ABC transporter permease [Acidimicrobiia bacterium]|nr:ABC transporter permease [Acidimicrobiia bacterium]